MMELRFWERKYNINGIHSIRKCLLKVGSNPIPLGVFRIFLHGGRPSCQASIRLGFVGNLLFTKKVGLPLFLFHTRKIS